MGPVVSGITTMASSGAMSLPRGDTAYRGGRGRGIFGGGRTVLQVSINTIDYVTIATLVMVLILVIYQGDLQNVVDLVQQEDVLWVEDIITNRR